MRARTVLALTILGVSLPGRLRAEGLDDLRRLAALSSSEEVRAQAAAQEAITRRDAAAEKLKGMEEGGPVDERERAQVRALVEESASLSASLSAARERAQAAREALRLALFGAASDRSGAADSASRAGHREEARRLDGEALALLAEAQGLGPSDPCTALSGVWKGYDAEIPPRAAESAASLRADARAYTDAAERMREPLSALEARRGGLDAAVRAFTHLTRFQGVLNRGGATPVDPSAERDCVAQALSSGQTLQGSLRKRAEERERRAQALSGGPQ